MGAADRMGLCNHFLGYEWEGCPRQRLTVQPIARFRTDRAP